MINTYLSSSNIDRIGFQQGCLFVQFKSGGYYRYDGAPYSTYQLLERAESPGSTFHRFVKGKYTYTRLDQNPFC